jgi:hypothetical protein
LAQEDPEQSVGGSQAWPRRGALEDGQLVPQREILEHQGAAGFEHAEEACEDEGGHACPSPYVKALRCQA